MIIMIEIKVFSKLLSALECLTRKVVLHIISVLLKKGHVKIENIITYSHFLFQQLFLISFFTEVLVKQ